MPEANQACLFCKIVAGQIPANFVYKDDHCVAFKDIQPRAPHHYLLIPRQHVSHLGDITEASRTQVGRLLECAGKIAKQQGLEQGYRCVINNGSDAGQEVAHLHIHILAGRRLTWPPG